MSRKRKDADALQTIEQVLIKRALSGLKEKCPLCGEEVLSVAVHFSSCPTVAAARREKP